MSALQSVVTQMRSNQEEQKDITHNQEEHWHILTNIRIRITSAEIGRSASWRTHNVVSLVMKVKDIESLTTRTEAAFNDDRKKETKASRQPIDKSNEDQYKQKANIDAIRQRQQHNHTHLHRERMRAPSSPTTTKGQAAKTGADRSYMVPSATSACHVYAPYLLSSASHLLSDKGDAFGSVGLALRRAILEGDPSRFAKPKPAREGAHARRERRVHAEARLRQTLVRDGALLAGHRVGPVQTRDLLITAMQAEVRGLRQTVAALVVAHALEADTAREDMANEANEDDAEESADVRGKRGGMARTERKAMRRSWRTPRARGARRRR